MEAGAAPGALASPCVGGCWFEAESEPAFERAFKVSISCCWAATCFCVCIKASRSVFSSVATSELFDEESSFSGLFWAKTAPDNQQ